MRISFAAARDCAATEYFALRERAIDKHAFDVAAEAMQREGCTANTRNGETRRRDGRVARFTNYTWSQDYEQQPSLIFYDFFRGELLNKYQAILSKRG